MTDLTSRLRAIIRPAIDTAGSPAPPRRELTYEPDDGRRYEAAQDLARVAAVLGGRTVETPFGACLAIDRRFEADRRYGDVQVGDCDPGDLAALRLLDPGLDGLIEAGARGSRVVFVDLETTGLSGGAGTVAFLVGCGYFDLGAFQVRQLLLTSHGAERALLAAAADLLEGATLIVTYNGKAFDIPVMETRWAFHRVAAPLDALPHFDMLHPARRLWKARAGDVLDSGCRLTTLERVLLNVRRVGDVDGFEIPGRFFQFLRTADAAPLEPVLEHNRLDLVSLAAVTSLAARLVREGHAACRDEREALALGRLLERAGACARAEACYRHAAGSPCPETRSEALYRLGLRCRRERRFEDAAVCWRELIALGGRRGAVRPDLRQFAIEALAIHHEHRVRDLPAARTLARHALDEDDHPVRAAGMRHRLARLDRKLARTERPLFAAGGEC